MTNTCVRLTNTDKSSNKIKRATKTNRKVQLDKVEDLTKAFDNDAHGVIVNREASRRRSSTASRALISVGSGLFKGTRRLFEHTRRLSNF